MKVLNGEVEDLHAYSFEIKVSEELYNTQLELTVKIELLKLGNKTIHDETPQENLNPNVIEIEIKKTSLVLPLLNLYQFHQVLLHLH